VEVGLGEEFMRERRPVDAARELTNGPGKLCLAMAIDRSLDGVDLCDASAPLFIARNPAAGKFREERRPMITGTRIGLTKAADLPLRFYLEGSMSVSQRRGSGRENRRPKTEGQETSMSETEPKSFVLKDCVSIPQNPASLVEYAADSIVSKPILDKPAGNLTLFAFDRGQRLTEHTSPYDAVVEVLDGKASLTIGGRDVEATAGQLIIMPANVPHDVRAETRFKMLLIMIR
jgi:quercetin dioxygenase-like cupin family protein